jgi:hypothetical protein
VGLVGVWLVRVGNVELWLVGVGLVHVRFVGFVRHVNDATGSVHSDVITCLNWYRIAQGTADGTYGAGRAVTRAQLATFLVRVLNEADIELPAGPEDAFSDDDGNTHEHNLNALAALGVFNGAGDGTVSPNEPVHRDQMASLHVRIVELIDDEQLADALEDYFDDDDHSVHNDAINPLARLGLAAGKAEGIFDPPGRTCCGSRWRRSSSASSTDSWPRGTSGLRPVCGCRRRRSALVMSCRVSCSARHRPGRDPGLHLRRRRRGRRP